MVRCMVDVEPKSLFGVTCGMEIKPGTGCPDHKFETEPAVLHRPEPDSDAIVAGLTKIIEQI